MMSGFRQREYATITFQELESWIEQEIPVKIIDLRDAGSYTISHFKGASNLPFEEMEEWQTDLPWGETLVFYCSRGSTSMMVCSRLSAAGYIAVNVAGGYTFYKGKYAVKGFSPL
ncbi:rhodanese-like domain-containing protein [Lachnospiraceae bacterium 62-35]